MKKSGLFQARFSSGLSGFSLPCRAYLLSSDFFLDPLEIFLYSLCPLL
jgi:hypothetical protein